MTLPPYSDEDTSKAAAESVAESATSMRERVYNHLTALYPGGATDDEMEVALGMRHQTLSARRWELAKDGMVEPSGRYRQTRSGRSAQVWRIKK